VKQTITPVQLQELTPEQREGLREWWKPKLGDMFVWQSTNTSGLIGPLGPIVTHIFGDGTFMATGTGSPLEHSKDECYPLLSIGQAIELLAEKDLLQLQSVFTKICLGILPASDLINALFAAVKEVL